MGLDYYDVIYKIKTVLIVDSLKIKEALSLPKLSCILLTFKQIYIFTCRRIGRQDEDPHLVDPLQQSSNIRVKIRVSNSPELHKASKIETSFTQELPVNPGFLPSIKKKSGKLVDNSDYGDQMAYHTRRYMKQYAMIDK